MVGALMAFLLMPGSVQATSLSLEYLGAASGYRTLTIMEAPIDPIASGLLPKNVSAGAFEMRDTTPGSALGTFIAWCLDISHWLGTSGTYVYETTTTPFSNSYGLSAVEQSRVQAFFDANYYIGLADDRDRSAGFQMGLWEVLYDDDFSLTANTAATGEFWGSAGSGADTAFALAGNYLTSAMNYADGKKWNLTFLESQSDPSKQNLITVSAVPLPAAGLLLIGGLAGLGLMSRRRRRS